MVPKIRTKRITPHVKTPEKKLISSKGRRDIREVIDGSLDFRVSSGRVTSRSISVDGEFHAVGVHIHQHPSDVDIKRRQNFVVSQD